MIIDANGSSDSGARAKPRWWSALRGRKDSSGLDLTAYRRLALQLQHDLSQGATDRSVLLVTPADSGIEAHGIAALASCVGEEVCGPVLLVDACPSEPKTSRLFGCADCRGLADLQINPELPLGDLVLTTTNPNVSFLPAGHALRNGNGSLGHQAQAADMGAFLRKVESRYSFVLLSGGPVLHNPLLVTLTQHVARVLLLVTENETRLEDLDAAQDALALYRARRVALVLVKAGKSKP